MKDGSGKFKAKHDRGELLELLRELLPLAADAHGIGPHQVTQLQFDLARVDAGHSDVPTARQICQRLERDWDRLRRKVLDPGSDLARTIATHRSFAAEHEYDTIPEQTIINAIRRVARFLQLPDSAVLQETAYRQARLELLRDGQRRYRHGRSLPLPSPKQIVAACGSWTRALGAAGLPTYDPTKGVHRGCSEAEVLDRCFEAHGVLPTQDEMQRWGRAQGIPISKPDKPWAEQLKDFEARWRERGVEVPLKPPPLGQRPDYDAPGDSSRAGEKRVYHHTDQERIAAVIDYLDQLPADENASAHSYQAWSTGHPARASLPSIVKRIGWSKALEQARRIRRERESA